MRLLAIILALSLLPACKHSGGSGQGRNHRVRSGESLFAIAESAYGNGLEWPRIWEANPWLDPDRLRSGEIIYVPPRDGSWGDPPSHNYQDYRLYEADQDLPEEGEVVDGALAGLASANPGQNGFPGAQVFRNLATQVSAKTFMGMPLQHTVAALFIFFLVHAAVQSVLVWLAANLTFVKDASMKKAIKAVFQADMLTFFTLVLLSGVGAILVYTGSAASSEAGVGSQLFPALENQLQNPLGMVIGACSLLLVYIILSLRFLPQAFGLHRGRVVPLVCLSILLPHLGALYVVGQRLGWIF